MYKDLDRLMNTVVINREDAINMMAWKELVNLAPQKRLAIIQDQLHHNLSAEELEALDGSLEIYNKEVLAFLRLKLICVTNQYMEQQLADLYRSNVTITGNPVEHEVCPCCSFRTLPEIGDYDICPNCYWEDDGIRNPEYYSSVNHMTLQEGMINFRQYGACSQEFVQYVALSTTKYPR